MLNMLDNKPESKKEEDFIKYVLSSKKEWKNIIIEITSTISAHQNPDWGLTGFCLGLCPRPRLGLLSGALPQTPLRA